MRVSEKTEYTLKSKVPQVLATAPKTNNGGGDYALQKHLVSGTAGGLASTVALYPLDLIKTRYVAILLQPGIGNLLPPHL